MARVYLLTISHVHGDIRHLENLHLGIDHNSFVHGDIRHLENLLHQNRYCYGVHGDIRHLESVYVAAPATCAFMATYAI